MDSVSKNDVIAIAIFRARCGDYGMDLAGTENYALSHEEAHCKRLVPTGSSHQDGNRDAVDPKLDRPFRRENVLRVPTEAILEGNKLLVYDAATGRLSAREIDLGIANWEFTEIAGGVEAAEVVVLSTGRVGVADGGVVVAEDEIE